MNHQLDDTVEVEVVRTPDNILPQDCRDCYSCQVEYYAVNCTNPKNPLKRGELCQFPTKRLLLTFNNSTCLVLPPIPCPVWCPRMG